jgi:hypothetical protein
MARRDLTNKRVGGIGRGIQDPNPSEEEGAILEFFGQLPDSTPREGVRVRGKREENGDLAWIRRDKWDSVSFSVEDCFPIGDRDVWT